MPSVPTPTHEVSTKPLAEKSPGLRYVTPGVAFSGGEVFRPRHRFRDWSAWVAHLRKRDTPAPAADGAPGKGSPLVWALPGDLYQTDSAELISRLVGRDGSRRDSPPAAEEFAAWLAESRSLRADAGLALECVALVHALPRLAAAVPEDIWWELLDQALAVADEASALSPVAEPMTHQMAAGELPLTLRYVLPEMVACRQLLKPAAAAISLGLEELLDGNGFLHAANLGIHRPLLACWTRCGRMLRELTGASLTRDARLQYEWFVRQALRLTRADGTPALSNGAPPDQWSELFQAALELGGDKNDRLIAQRALPGGKDKSKPATAKLPRPAAHSEWAETAILRSDWSAGGPRLLVSYSADAMLMELESNQEVVLSGSWHHSIQVAGRPLKSTGNWCETCWFSDKDVDYLELEVELDAPWRLQRHVLLAREERFLLLADAVIGAEAAPIEYRGLLPIAPQTEFHAAEETWEGRLEGRRPAALVLPLALPEWRRAARHGTLRQSDDGLRSQCHGTGTALFAPLLLDLDPRRMGKPFTWRQLTIAEQLEIVPSDVAVAYRVQLGKQNWLIYRSLAPTGNRTFMGHNLTAEFLCARFDRDGSVTPLVEIE